MMGADQLRSASGRRNTLPAQPGPLIGREDDVPAAARRLQCEDVRLLTLTGPAGVGKTRLGLAVAATAAGHFPDGVWFVDLTSLTDAGLVVPAVAQALGVHQVAERPVPDIVRDQVNAVVAYAPFGVTLPTSWTFRGAPLPGLPPLPPERLADFPQDEPKPLTPRFLARLADDEAVRAYAIPVELTRCPILMISGRDDQMWPSALMADTVMERLKAHGYSYPAQHLAYPGAGHYLRFPYLPTTIHAIHLVSGVVYALGGTPDGDAAANADSWCHVLAFLRESLKT